jgi:hypothetical protein
MIVAVGKVGIGDEAEEGAGVSGNEPNATGLHDANKTSKRNLHNALTVISLSKEPT